MKCKFPKNEVMALSHSWFQESPRWNIRVDHSDRKKVLVTSLTTLQLLMQKIFCYEKNPLRAMEHFYVFSAERKQRVS